MVALSSDFTDCQGSVNSCLQKKDDMPDDIIVFSFNLYFYTYVLTHVEWYNSCRNSTIHDQCRFTLNQWSDVIVEFLS